MENLDLIEELENKNPNLEKVSELYEQLEKALVSDPNDGKKWTELGHCSFILGNDKRAHESYQNALIFNCVDTPDLWYGIGLLYYKNSNFKLALYCSLSTFNISFFLIAHLWHFHKHVE